MAPHDHTNEELLKNRQQKSDGNLSSTSSLHSVVSSSAQFRENFDQIPTFSIPEGFDGPSASGTAGVPPEIDGLIDGVEAASLQQRRLSLFDYQPCSLPPSRVCFSVYNH